MGGGGGQGRLERTGKGEVGGGGGREGEEGGSYERRKRRKCYCQNLLSNPSPLESERNAFTT